MRPKLARKINKVRGQSMALEYLIGRLKETIRSQKIEHSEMEAEWKKETQLLSRSLNDERSKVYQFLNLFFIFSE